MGSDTGASPTQNAAVAPSSGANPVRLAPLRTLIVLGGVDRNGAFLSPQTYTAEADLGVGWQRATLANDNFYAIEAPTDRLASLREVKIRYKPAKTYWQVNGVLRVGSPWELKAPSAKPADTPEALHDLEEATNFYPAWDWYDTTGTLHIIVVVAIFSKVRDATDVVLKKLQTPPASRKGYGGGGIAQWAPPALTNHHFLGSPVLTGGPPKLVNLRQQGSTVPQCWDRVLAVRDEVAVPRLYAVSCPTRLDALAAASGKLPVLVYIHPDMQQNVQEGYYEGALVKDQEPYPWGWDYLYFGLYRYMRYTGDPKSDPFSKGLPYQIADAGRAVMTVLPLNKAYVEVAPLMDSTYLLEVLQELTAYVQRRKEVGRLTAVDPVGDVALAAFSAGCAWIPKFLDRNAKTPFGANRLKEVYSFDAAFNTGDLGQVVRATTAWASEDPARIVRIYSQSAVAFHGLTKQAAFYASVPPPYDVSSGDGNRTTVVITSGAWASTVGRSADFQDAHQLISAFCLRDAIYRSRFPT